MMEFPRSNDRGPIEATTVSAEPPLVVSFPRSNDRGPIEARGWSWNAQAGRLFPRSNDRGPIEAELHRLPPVAISAVERPRPH